MGHRSRYLVNEEPIPLYPSLAVALGGADRALVLQQLNYWLVRSKHLHDGRYWVYNSVRAWRAQFPWMSEPTIARTLKHLEDRGLVLTGNYNKIPTDRTKWYTIDDEMIKRLLATVHFTDSANASYQNDQMEALGVIDSIDHSDRMQSIILDSSNQRDRSETTQESTQRLPAEGSKAPPPEGTAQEQHVSVIRRYIADYSKEFDDVEHTAANCTRALNLWRRSGQSRYDFLGAMVYARGATRQYQGKQPAGVRIERKMAYFFTVIENWLRSHAPKADL